MSPIFYNTFLLALLALSHIAQSFPTPMALLSPSVVDVTNVEQSETGLVADFKQKNADNIVAAKSESDITGIVEMIKQEDENNESGVEKRDPAKQNKTKGYGTAPAKGEGGCGGGTCKGGKSFAGTHRGAGHYKALVGQGGYYGKNGIKVAKGGNAEGRAKAKQHPYTGKPGVHGHHRV